MTQLQAIRWFINQVLTNETITFARHRDQWGMGISSSTPRLTLPSNLMENDDDDKLFRKDFIQRYSSARGFANVTLTLLHELGHWHTRNDVDWIEYMDQASRTKSMNEYLALPAEQIATDWAIQWLSDASHRRLAKQFERFFFVY